MGNYREILPKMVSISNNSIITNRLSLAIAEKLTTEEFVMFQHWLKIIEQERQNEINNSNNGIKRFRNL